MPLLHIALSSDEAKHARAQSYIHFVVRDNNPIPLRSEAKHLYWPF